MCQTTAKDMNQYIRHSTVDFATVTKAVLEASVSSHVERLQVGEHSVGVTSLRLKTFTRDFNKFGKLFCSCCGLDATFFAVENFARGNPASFPHVNLYGVKDGADVLFTHDHTIARVFGGTDNLENTTTMCLACNSRKGCEEGIRAAAMGIKRKNKPKNKKRYKNASD